MSVRPLLSLLAVLAALAAAACTTKSNGTRVAEALGGDPLRGRDAIRRYGCGSCHTVPGLREARSLVGPPLVGIAERSYIAGVLPNTPENMVRWIVSPPAVDSLTAMPDMGVTTAEARDITSYLYSRR